MTEAITLRSKKIAVSLVDGEPAVRRARQIMLRSEDYEVRSYPTCDALLADPLARNCPCIVVDVHMTGVDGIALLVRMRATGWGGRAILLDGIAPGSALMREAQQHGDTVLRRTVSDSALLAAIDASVGKGLTD